ncbi:MAG: glutaminase, partial [Rhodococcus sp. (in: high G+C Gram-positive bacteria)]
PRTDLVIFDMSRVDEVMPVAERTSSETATKLIEEGYRIIVVDPEGTVENFTDSQGRAIERWTPEQLSNAME